MGLGEVRTTSSKHSHVHTTAACCACCAAASLTDLHGPGLACRQYGAMPEAPIRTHMEPVQQSWCLLCNDQP